MKKKEIEKQKEENNKTIYAHMKKDLGKVWKHYEDAISKDNWPTEAIHINTRSKENLTPIEKEIMDRCKKMELKFFGIEIQEKYVNNETFKK